MLDLKQIRIFDRRYPFSRAFSTPELFSFAHDGRSQGSRMFSRAVFFDSARFAELVGLFADVVLSHSVCFAILVGFPKIDLFDRRLDFPHARTTRTVSEDCLVRQCLIGLSQSRISEDCLVRQCLIDLSQSRISEDCLFDSARFVALTRIFEDCTAR